MILIELTRAVQKLCFLTPPVQPLQKLLSTRRSTLVLGGECNRTSVSTLLAQLALC